MILDQQQAREAKKIFDALGFFNKCNLMNEDRKTVINFCKGRIYLFSHRFNVMSEDYASLDDFCEAYKELIFTSNKNEGIDRE